MLVKDRVMAFRPASAVAAPNADHLEKRVVCEFVFCQGPADLMLQVRGHRLSDDVGHASAFRNGEMPQRLMFFFRETHIRKFVLNH